MAGDQRLKCPGSVGLSREWKANEGGIWNKSGAAVSREDAVEERRGRRESSMDASSTWTTAEIY